MKTSSASAGGAKCLNAVLGKVPNDLVRHRRRFDIHLDDGTRRIAVGEFDIEIAG